ncbi:MAG: tol-pal system YbgF family protein [Myxococcota bacterium]
MDHTAVDVLLNVRDPAQRGQAHLWLGRQALELGQRGTARRHFQEAALMTPGDPEVRAELQRVGVAIPVPAPRRGWLGLRRA